MLNNESQSLPILFISNFTPTSYNQQRCQEASTVYMIHTALNTHQNLALILYAAGR
jgi:hypothetical protein